MSLRLTEAQARRLGIRRGATAAATRDGRSCPPEGRGQEGRGREGRGRRPIHHAGDAVVHRAEVAIDLPLPPRPKESPRTVLDPKSVRDAFFAARGDVEAFLAILKRRTFIPAESRRFMDAARIAAQAAMRGRPPFDVPVEAAFEFRFSGDPSYWPTAAGDGDLDNLQKAVCDAMNGVVYADDRLIVRSSNVKLCSREEGIRVSIRPATPPASSAERAA